MSTPYSRDPENPWTTHSSQIHYDNPWIRVTQHEVTHPGGESGIYGTVHFKNIATGAVPLDEDLNTWLVGQYRYPLGVYSWEIPEGGGDPELDPVVSIQRELLEETGITAATWTPLVTLHLSNSVSDELACIYIARDLSFGESQPEPDEELMVHKLPFMEAYELVCAGKITDAMSVAGILKTRLWLEEQGMLPSL